MAIWAIVGNYLYLCDIALLCDDNTHPSLEDYRKGFSRGLTPNDLFLIKLIPLEELTGRKFQKHFPIGILKYPLNGYALFADWFNDTIKIKEEDEPSYFAPYQQLEFEAGKVISLQNMIYYEWEEISNSLKKQKEKRDLKYLLRPVEE
jgi:hypothetical protein